MRRTHIEWLDPLATRFLLLISIMAMLVTSACPAMAAQAASADDCLTHTAIERSIQTGILESESSFTVNTKSPDNQLCDVASVEIVDIPNTYAYADGLIEYEPFSSESAFNILPTSGDASIDFSTIKLGDYVSTSSFNGIYMLSIPGDATSQMKEEAIQFITAICDLISKEYPEIFWLNDQHKARIITRYDQTAQAEVSCYFLLLADAGGYSLCSDKWRAPGSIEAGIKRREAAVNRILNTVTAIDTTTQIRQINKWLTENNQYNTSPDLFAIGSEPHECLAALEGNIGMDGPVCDGYVKAFKVLCDRLGIPCVLKTGWAIIEPEASPQFHMWAQVQVDGKWYGSDITWNDPNVKDCSSARSGRENENYLLVGSDTVVNGMSFKQTHSVKTRGTINGFNFDDGPEMCSERLQFVKNNPDADKNKFKDVSTNDYFFDSVYWGAARNIVTGTSFDSFTPNRLCTQTEALTLLWRAAGRPVCNTAIPFELKPGVGYAKTALSWAYRNGMIDSSYDQMAPCTRADIVTFIWKYEGRPTAPAGHRSFIAVPSTSEAAEAVAWAVTQGITQGTSDTEFTPDRPCNRAEAVTFLYRWARTWPV